MNPTTEKIIALVALLGLIGFVMVILIFVGELNLIVVTTVGMLFAVYDFWRELFTRRGR